jgi:hypothetical protein
VLFARIETSQFKGLCERILTIYSTQGRTKMPIFIVFFVATKKLLLINWS